MKVEFAPSFEKDITSLRDAGLRSRLAKMIVRLEEARSLADVPQVKALSGHGTYYRCRIGDYRLGFEMDGDILRLLRFLDRKEIYRRFPPT